jgi:hypothetical protein
MEDQIPTAWSANEITLTVNSGGFVGLADKWLYVTNSDGEVNATGYSLNELGSPTFVCYKDFDSDRFGVGTYEVVEETCSAGYRPTAELIALSGDCNDSNASIHPGASEACDEIDSDCDGIDCEPGAVCDAGHLSMCLTNDECTSAGGNYCPPCQADPCPVGATTRITAKGVTLRIAP